MISSSFDSRSEAERLGLSLSDAAWIEHIRGAFQIPAPRRIGRYEILGESPRGGQGVVYRAIDTESQRVIALKRLAAGALASEKERFRFEREVEAARSLNHANIVRVIGLEVIDGQPLIAMEWVDGAPIDQWARSAWTDSPRALSAVLGVFLGVCDAVHHAHQRGVIHRDLKPANILVSNQMGAWERGKVETACGAAVSHLPTFPLSHCAQPKLLDFGIAKVNDSPSARLTGSKDFLGTPAYAAPEQISGLHDAVDVRTDVYALGVVLYEILSGRRPFDDSAGVARLFDAIRGGDFAPPARVAARLDGELDAIVLKAMAREPERRYQSADALAADIRRYRAGEPLEARRGQRWYRIKKLAWRHRIAATAAGACIGLVALAAVVYSVLYAQQKQATAEMTLARDAEAAARQDAQRSQAALSQILLNVAEAGRGTDPALRRMLLADAERGVERDLQDMPAVLASARDALGRTYQALGLYEEANRLLTSALETRIGLFGRNHPETATSIRNLARLRQDCSRYAEAEPLYREAARIRLAHFGPDHPTAAESWHDEGIIASNRQDFPAARHAFQEAAALRGRLLGDQHAETLDSRESVAYANASLGDFDAAVADMRIVLNHTRLAFGPDHRKTAGRHVSLGKFLAESGELDEAETHLRRGLELFRSLLGNRHDNVAWAAHRLGNVLHQRGCDEEAESLLLEARVIYEQVLGAADPFVAYVCESLGQFYLDMGCPTEAAAAQDAANRIRPAPVEQDSWIRQSTCAPVSADRP